jgi:lipopolysaccharide transport system ATP-binding protein
MNDPAVRVEDLGKRYRIGLRTRANRTFGEMLTERLAAPFRRCRRRAEGDAADNGLIWALRDVSFEIARGEVVGIIGANGAGKSTLLKILSRITEPTTGRAELHGSVGSLLEVGTGFHPELTGRENIYLNGAILGMKKAEIAAHFDEIVAFAELERFLDTPVKRYSSGMYVRLAFAVAAHLQPEILIVDEVLAVGDAAFQAKCLGTMGRVARQGRTVLLVSHNLAAITQICPRAILLCNGRMAFDGPAGEAVRRYMRQAQPSSGHVRFAPDPQSSAQLTALGVGAAGVAETGVVDFDTSFDITLSYTARHWTPGSYVCVAITNEAGVRLLWSSDVRLARDLDADREPGVYRARATVPAAVLPPGRYFVSAAIYAPRAETAVDFHDRAVTFEVRDHGSMLKRFGIDFPALTAIQLQWSTEHVACCTRQEHRATLGRVARIAAST